MQQSHTTTLPETGDIVAQCESSHPGDTDGRQDLHRLGAVILYHPPCLIRSKVWSSTIPNYIDSQELEVLSVK
jgi:hypothetical protein